MLKAIPESHLKSLMVLPAEAFVIYFVDFKQVSYILSSRQVFVQSREQKH